MTEVESRMTSDARMTNEAKRSLIRHSVCILASTLVIASAGCFPKPNKANIALRKEVQALKSEITRLEARDAAHAAQVKALETNRTIQTLPAERLNRLYTASGLKFKNLTIGQDLDRTKPGDEGFKIGIVPLDQFGEEFKSAGSIKVELFDLAAPDTRLGTWFEETTQTQKRWLSTPVIDAYVLSFPWQTVPTNAKLLVKATFTEELTGRVFEAEAPLTIAVPGK